MFVRKPFWMLLTLVVCVAVGGAMPVHARPDRQDRIPLTYGQSVTGTIDHIRFFQQYSFEGRAGDRIVVLMEALSGNLDPLLLLGDSQLNLIAEDDDGGGGFNARLEIVLPADGLYIIEATRFGQDSSAGRSTGDYRLSLMASQPGARAPTDMAGILAPLTFGKTQRGLLTARDRMHMLWFQGSAGDEVRVRGRYSAGVSATLVMYDPEMSELQRDSTGQELQYTLEDSGIYWIAVALNSPILDGTYALTLSGRLTDPITGLGDVYLLADNETVNGSITEERPEARYVFDGQVNDQVVIRMTATEGGLDPFLYLYGPNGEIIAQDDDGGGMPDAEISAVLPEAGRYTIVAARFARERGSTTGNYSLSFARTGVEDGDIEPAVVRASALPENFEGLPRIQVSDSVTGVLADQPYSQAYVLEAERGDTVVITLNTVAGDLDPVLMVLDSSLQVVAQHDDISDQNRNAQVTFTFPDDGFYAILAMRYDGEAGTTRGEYRLTVEDPEADLASQFVSMLPTREVLRDIASAQLGDQLADLYVFQAAQGDRVVLELDGTGALVGEELLILADGTLRELAASDSGRITYEIPRTGVYVVLVTRAGGPLGEGRGFYELSITGASADGSDLVGLDSPAFAPGEVIPYGTVLSGVITDADYRVGYRFSGLRGDRVSVSVEALDATLDPAVRILDAEGNVIAEDDDGGGDLNAFIPALLLVSDGEYQVEVLRSGGREGSSRGRFELILTGSSALRPETGSGGSAPEDAIPLAVGQTVVGSITNESSAIFYVLALEEDQRVQIDMVRTQGDLDSLLVMLDASQSMVAMDDDSGEGQDARLIVEAGSAGMYTLVASRYDFMNGNTTGDFVLSVVER